uniref:Uncharacterized protein LOC114348275 n=1 Tax=Diabrotica virgifera virgifera TaxID=50390 RepID=A0A6P7HAH0_DIAVI
MCREHGVDVLLVQETHRGTASRRPRIRGMKLILERPHDQYGSAVFVRPDIDVASTSLTDQNDIEILTVEINSCTVTSMYKPPNADFAFEEPNNFQSQQIKFVLGDFNCHSVAWGYNETGSNGEEPEKWAESMNIKLIQDPKQPLRRSFQEKVQLY